MQDYEDTIISNKFDCKRMVEFCTEDLEKYEDSVDIDKWTRYYYVYRFVSEKGKPRRCNMFILECDSEGVTPNVEYLIHGTVYYKAGKYAKKLLEKTLTIFDKRNAEKAKKAAQTKDTVKQQINQNSPER